MDTYTTSDTTDTSNITWTTSGVTLSPGSSIFINGGLVTNNLNYVLTTTPVQPAFFGGVFNTGFGKSEWRKTAMCIKQKERLMKVARGGVR
jgi:hypothetical protein